MNPDFTYIFELVHPVTRIVFHDSFVSMGQVLPGDGRGGYGLGLAWGGLGFLASSIATGDIDGDGATDVAAVSSTLASVKVLYGETNGSWDSTRSAPLPYPCSDVVLADFNGDGRLDLLASSAFGGQLAVLLNNGRRSFDTPRPLVVGASSHIAATGDLNDDGRTDAVVANHDTNDASVFLGRAG